MCVLCEQQQRKPFDVDCKYIRGETNLSCDADFYPFLKRCWSNRGYDADAHYKRQMITKIYATELMESFLYYNIICRRERKIWTFARFNASEIVIGTVMYSSM